MKAKALMNALTDQVEKLKTHQNKPAGPAAPKKQHKVRRMVQPTDLRIEAGKVVTA